MARFLESKLEKLERGKGATADALPFIFFGCQRVQIAMRLWLRFAQAEKLVLTFQHIVRNGRNRRTLCDVAESLGL